MVSDRGARARALVTAVQHFCLHDGPGTRSVVFFKGCPLRCVWCQNPETWSTEPQHFFKKAKCLGCGRCVEACREEVLESPGKRNDGCIGCFDCAEACPSSALSRVGAPYTVDELLAELRPEFPFLTRSGGGVTFSGGEPTFGAPHFAASLALRLGREGIPVALETCGSFALDGAAAQLLSQADLVLFDIKIFDRDQHRRVCGADNVRIKSNLELLADRAREGASPTIWPRLPLIPGLTDTPGNLCGWAGLLMELRLPALTLVPHHRLGESKREWLGLPPAPEPTGSTSDGLARAREIFRAAGIECFLPGEEAC